MKKKEIIIKFKKKCSRCLNNFDWDLLSKIEYYPNKFISRLLRKKIKHPGIYCPFCFEITLTEILLGIEIQD